MKTYNQHIKGFYQAQNTRQAIELLHSLKVLTANIDESEPIESIIKRLLEKSYMIGLEIKSATSIDKKLELLAAQINTSTALNILTVAIVRDIEPKLNQINSLVRIS